MQSVELKPSLPEIPCSLHHLSLLTYSRGKAESSRTSGKCRVSSLVEASEWLQQGVSDQGALPQDGLGSLAKPSAICRSPLLAAE